MILDFFLKTVKNTSRGSLPVPTSWCLLQIQTWTDNEFASRGLSQQHAIWVSTSENKKTKPTFTIWFRVHVTHGPDPRLKHQRLHVYHHPTRTVGHIMKTYWPKTERTQHSTTLPSTPSLKELTFSCPRLAELISRVAKNNRSQNSSQVTMGSNHREEGWTPRDCFNDMVEEEEWRLDRTRDKWFHCAAMPGW